jgi:hypothetical protein
MMARQQLWSVEAKALPLVVDPAELQSMMPSLSIAGWRFAAATYVASISNIQLLLLRRTES